MQGSRSGGQTVRRSDDQTVSAVTLSVAKGPELRLITQLVSFVRSVAGMPDYERHVEHLRRCHPEKPIPSQRQYYEEYLEARYTEGPTRCC